MQNRRRKVVKQWQAIYYPLVCPVIAIKVVKSYLRGIERDTTGLKSVSRRSLIGLINKGVNIMGREVRRVPANWDHWSYSDQPLFDNFRAKLARWVEHNDKWNQGFELNYTTKQWEPIADKYKNISYSEYDTTEGTPISPVMATEDDLIDWLVDNKASAFGDMTGNRDYWTSVVKQNSGGLITITKLK